MSLKLLISQVTFETLRIAERDQTVVLSNSVLIFFHPRSCEPFVGNNAGGWVHAFASLTAHALNGKLTLAPYQLFPKWIIKSVFI